MIDVSDLKLSELEAQGVEMVVTVCDKTMIWAPEIFESFFPVFSYSEIRLIHSLPMEEARACLLQVHGLKESFSSSVFCSSVSQSGPQCSWLEELCWDRRS